jgi:hypothetical protein
MAVQRGERVTDLESNNHPANQNPLLWRGQGEAFYA